MKKALVIFLVVIGIAVAAATMRQTGRQPVDNSQPRPAAQQRDARGEHPPQQASASATPRVPAHYKDAKSARPLAPTLDPQQFYGQARAAYQVAREIPETLAQLPCYCYCDEGFGHKSLHTCFETDHSSMCAVCVGEALMAYKLQKEDGLTPDQVRERIIERYSAMHQNSSMH
ncbi:MAG: CYCXC family (seleno)protein [Pyrinomonadaceae bacterium]